MTRLLVISDPHVQEALAANGAAQESWWVVGARDPNWRNDPVDSLTRLLAEWAPELDGIIVPGDISHKASSQALNVGWDRLRLLAHELGDIPLIATLGNHDCHSRASTGDPFGPAKLLPRFPCSAATDADQYWTRGFAIVELADSAKVVVINSALHHYSEREARAGTFPQEKIDVLSEALRGVMPGPVLAVLHHHPILHSNPLAGSADVLPTGDLLLAALGRSGVNVILHGHRHEPRIRRGDSHNCIVIAAGSFSILLERQGSLTRNLVHLLEVDSSNGPVAGAVKTWEFNAGFGWQPATRRSASIPHVARFSVAKPELSDLVDRVVAAMRGRTPTWLEWDDGVSVVPDLLSLLPDEVDELCQELASRFHVTAEYGELGQVLRWTLYEHS